MHTSWLKLLQLGGLLSILVFPAAGYGQFYLGGGAGQSTFKDVDQVESACTTVGAVCEADDTDTGYKFFGGYQFGDFLALEGGYIDMGKSAADATVPFPASASLTAKGAYFAILPRVPIGPVGTIFGRAGLSVVDAELSASGGGFDFSDSSGAVGVVFGVGAEIHLTEQISVRGEWERHSFDEALEIAGVEIDAPDIDMISGSLVIRF